MGHSELGGSSAERWLTCPGSVALCRKYPSTDSEASLEGTRAHHCVEILAEGGDRKSLELFFDKTWIDENLHHFKVFSDYVQREGAQAKTVDLEVKVVLDKILGVEDQSGTGDCVMTFQHYLEVVDYKNGVGKYVCEKRNKQLIYYALGALEKYGWDKFKTVRITIIQPRYPNAKAVRSDNISIEEMKRYAKEYYKGAQLTLTSKKLVYGDHCFFCPAKIECPKVTEYHYGKGDGFDVIKETTKKSVPKALAIVDKKALAPDVLGSYLEKAYQLELWCKDVKAMAEQTLRAGGKVTGFKLVEGKGQRRWANSDEVAEEAKELFGSKAFTKRELLSPAQLEKVVSKKWVKDRVMLKYGSPTVAPDSDSRPEYGNAIVAGFKNLNEGKGDKMAKKKAAKKTTAKKTVKKAAPKKKTSKK